MLAAKCQYKLRIQTGLHNKTDMHQSEQKYLLQSQGDTGFLDAPARQSSGESQRVSAFFCNTKEGGHAPAAASTFGATAYKKPVWHSGSSKNFSCDWCMSALFCNNGAVLICSGDAQKAARAQWLYLNAFEAYAIGTCRIWTPQIIATVLLWPGFNGSDMLSPRPRRLHLSQFGCFTNLMACVMP